MTWTIIGGYRNSGLGERDRAGRASPVPPPTSAAVVEVRCGACPGGRRTSGLAAGSTPAIACHAVTSRAAS